MSLNSLSASSFDLNLLPHECITIKQCSSGFQGSHIFRDSSKYFLKQTDSNCQLIQAAAEKWFEANQASDCSLHTELWYTVIQVDSLWFPMAVTPDTEMEIRIFIGNNNVRFGHAERKKAVVLARLMAICAQKIFCINCD